MNTTAPGTPVEPLTDEDLAELDTRLRKVHLDVFYGQYVLGTHGVLALRERLRAAEFELHGTNIACNGYMKAALDLADKLAAERAVSAKLTGRVDDLQQQIWDLETQLENAQYDASPSSTSYSGGRE